MYTFYIISEVSQTRCTTALNYCPPKKAEVRPDVLINLATRGYLLRYLLLPSLDIINILVIIKLI